MKLKSLVVMLYSLGLLMAVAISTGASATSGLTQQQAGIITLDLKGERGVVQFNHKTHEAAINPDGTWPYPAKAGAACAGCHHTVSKRGIPQLWKCSACHRGEGDPRNPKNRDFDEVWSERAFHDTCIACHRASTKGPTTCGGCHKSGG